MASNKAEHLKEVARLFLKLGIIGFGGPAVHIALMQKEVVEKRQWMSHEHFLDLIGATNLIPGPNSTEMTMHCGHERAGWQGLVVAGFCFIMPAVLITGTLAWAYQTYGSLPEVAPFLYCIKPAIIAVIVSVMITLGKKAWKNTTLGIIGIAAAIVALLGINEIAVLFGAGAIGMLLQSIKHNRSLNVVAPVTLPAAKLFWIFLKIGAILYGSGYVLFSFLDSELVAKGILSRQQLIDAIAVGQFTPGPVFSAATFIGWQIGGIGGAAAATLGIFLPSFLFVALLNPLIPRLRRSKIMAAFLDTVNIVSVALILVTCINMGRDAIQDWRTITIAVLSFATTIVFKKLNTAFIIIGGASLGYLLQLF